tara:strand:+ start:496 stop:1008 length:513 start_codon:yes stop_codon:yes gene_type:complete
MANRVLLGNHPNHGQGLYVSPTGDNVLASDKSEFLFDSTAASQAQLLCWHEVTTTSSHNGSSLSFDYSNFGVRNFAFAFGSQITGASETASDVSCVSQASGSARASASYAIFGGALGALNSTADLGNDINYTIELTDQGSGVGRCTINRTSPSSSAKDFIVNVLIFKEKA